ncbi:MAG: cysteine synthase B, partial [Deltaproteobacteria bacterium]
GNTPLVEITNINPNKKVRILAKLEGNNPSGSVKDRAAYYMIKEAEKNGELTKDKIILEPTSGNTGIGLAMVAAAKGYKAKLVMPACVSEERRRILEAFGTELELSPANQGVDGAIRRARKILEARPDTYYMPDQYSNKNNVRAHYEGTGPEIIKQTKGDINVFVAGMGTTGTLMGTGQYLKEYNPNIKIVGIEPTLGHRIQGLKNMNESIVPKIFDPKKLDERIIIDDESAFDMTRKLALKEGIFVGMSSGAAMAGALRIAQEIDSGTIVIIFPDRGDRYLSTALFTSICAECPP